MSNPAHAPSGAMRGNSAAARTPSGPQAAGSGGGSASIVIVVGASLRKRARAGHSVSRTRRPGGHPLVASAGQAASSVISAGVPSSRRAAIPHSVTRSARDPAMWVPTPSTISWGPRADAIARLAR